MPETNYKDLIDYDEEENQLTHPVVKALRQGGTIQSVKLMNDWHDDHCPCFAVEMVVDGDTYQYNDWWLSGDGAKMYYRSECEGTVAEEARKRLLGHLIDHV